jgi:hypothetical protein
MSGNPLPPLPVCRSFEFQDQMAKDSTHVEDTVRALAELRQEHERKASTLQRVMGRLTGGAAGPGFIILLTAILIFWIAINSALFFLGMAAIAGYRPVQSKPRRVNSRTASPLRRTWSR